MDLHIQDILSNGHVVRRQDHPPRINLHHTILLIEHPIQQLPSLRVQFRKRQNWSRPHIEKKMSVT